MGIQAVLSESVDVFNKRLEKLDSILCSNPSKSYKEIIIEIEEDCKKTQDYDLLAFFEDMEVCMHINEYPELFESESRPKDRASPTSITSAISLIASPKLKEKGEVINIDKANFSGSYQKDDLLRYFDSLEKNLLKEPIATTPITLELNSPNHAITVGYDPKEKTWFFVDVTKLLIKKLKSTEAIADHVIGAFPDFMKAEGCIPMSTIPYITNKPIGLTTVFLKKKLENWQESEDFKDIHAITPGSFKNSTRLTLAVQIGDLPAIKSLIDLGSEIDLNKLNNKGATPLMDAILESRTEVVKLLIAAGADVNKKSSNNLTAYDIALEKRNFAALSAIAQSPNFHMRTENEAVADQLESNPHLYLDLSIEMKNSPEVKSAVKANPGLVYGVSLEKYNECMANPVRSFLLGELRELFQDNREVILAAVAMSPREALPFVKNKVIAIETVTQNGVYLRMLDKELRNDKDVVIAAVTQAGDRAFDYASVALQDDPDVIAAYEAYEKAKS